MDETAARRFLEAYLGEFGPSVRGEPGAETALLACYHVPLLLSWDGGVRTLTSAAEVAGAVGGHVQAARAAGFARGELRAADVTILNGSTVLARVEIARLRDDGTELDGLRGSYLLVETAAGPRIAAIAALP